MSSSTDWHRKRKQHLVEYKGGKCMDCGLTFPPCCYDFDHRNPFDKSFAISQETARGRTPMCDLEKEADKCDLVCANCHRIRTYDNKQISAKMRAGMKGLQPWNKGLKNPYSPETLIAMSAGQKKRFEALGPFKRRPKTPEERKQISDRHKALGIRPSLEACRLGGAAVTGEKKKRWGNQFAKKKVAA